MLKIEEHSSIKSLRHLRSDWNRLVDENETNEIFLTYEWYEAWEKASDEDELVIVLTAVRENHLVGIAPLVVKSASKNGVSYKSLRFFGIGDYCDFIVLSEQKNDIIYAFLKYLMSLSIKWDTIELYNVPENTNTLNAAQKAAGRLGLDFSSGKDMVCPALVLEDDMEFAKACLKKKSVVRHYNYFKKRGKLEFKNLKNRDQIISSLELFFEQHIKRREYAGGSSLFLIPNRKKFYYQLIECFPINWIHFTQVNFNGDPIAYHFGFFYNNKLVWYKPSFDTGYAKYSPGEVHLRYLIKQAIDLKAREFDFTIGDEKFKRRFSNTIRHSYRMQIIRSKKIRLYWKTVEKVKNLLRRIY